MTHKELKELINVSPENQQNQTITSIKMSISWVFGFIFLVIGDFISFRLLLPYLVSSTNSILVLIGGIWAVTLIAIHIFLIVILFTYYFKKPSII